MNVILAPLLFILLFFLMVWVVRSKKPLINPTFSVKKNYLFAGVYITLLIAMIPIYYNLPSKDFIQAKRGENPVIVRSPQELKTNELSLPLNDRINSLKNGGEFQSSTQSIKVDAPSLTLEESNPSGRYSIFVQRKDVEDSKVEVSTYTRGGYVGDIDFTKALLPPSISMEKGTLIINAPPQQNFEFVRFESDFVLRQFNRPYPEPLNHYSSMFSPTIIWVQVPKNLEIVDQTNNMQFVN